MACYFIAVISAYRAGAFMHEIVHQKSNKKFSRAFIWFWNLTIGVFALYPSPRFNVHLRHHQLGVFGTEQDPQYPLIKREGKWQLKESFFLFVVLPLAFPLLNLLRVASLPFDLIYPWAGIRKKLLFLFQKPVSLSSEDWKIVFVVDVCSFFFMIAIAILCPLQWYSVVVGAWFLSSLRVPLEHSYIEHKKTTGKRDQQLDSFDIVRTWKKPVVSLYSLIVQPVGSNLHRIHHENPSIFYWKLKAFSSSEIETNV